jgi:hypothetical protein
VKSLVIVGGLWLIVGGSRETKGLEKTERNRMGLEKTEERKRGRGMRKMGKKDILKVVKKKNNNKNILKNRIMK